MLYSAVYGDGYDSFKDVRGLDVPAVMYVENDADAEQAESAGWTVRVEPLPAIATTMLRAKWWKTMPELAVPEADVSVWIDGAVIPSADLGARCIDALGDDDWSLTPHPWRDCIYTELEASIGMPKYSDTAMRRQVERYRSDGHPPNWGLFASGAMTRRHTPNVIGASHSWWKECIVHHHQDQLSLPRVIRSWCPALRWNSNMQWAGDWWGFSVHGLPE